MFYDYKLKRLVKLGKWSGSRAVSLACKDEETMKLAGRATKERPHMYRSVNSFGSNRVSRPTILI
jgi:hypothetical protein